MIFGLGIGFVSGLNAHDRFTLLVEFAVRNIAIAIAVTILNRTEFAVFATVYFLTQVPLVVSANFFSKGCSLVDIRFRNKDGWVVISMKKRLETYLRVRAIKAEIIWLQNII